LITPTPLPAPFLTRRGLGKPHSTALLKPRIAYEVSDTTFGFLKTLRLIAYRNAVGVELALEPIFMRIGSF